MKLFTALSFASMAMARALPQSGQAFAEYKAAPMAAPQVLYTMDNKASGNNVLTFPVADDGTIANQGPSYPTGGAGERTIDFFNGTAGGEKDAIDSQGSVTIAGNVSHFRKCTLACSSDIPLDAFRGQPWFKHCDHFLDRLQ